MKKLKKAIYTPGPAFLNVLAPCPRGWRYNTPDLMELSKLAVETCFWPLYEVIDGKYIIKLQAEGKSSRQGILETSGKI